MPLVSLPVAGLTPESVSRFLVGGFMEVLAVRDGKPRDPTDLSGPRRRSASTTVNALLGPHHHIRKRSTPWPKHLAPRSAPRRANRAAIRTTCTGR